MRMTTETLRYRLTATSKSSVKYLQPDYQAIYTAVIDIATQCEANGLEYKIDHSPYSPSVYIRIYTTHQGGVNDGLVKSNKFKISNHSNVDLNIRDTLQHIANSKKSVINFINNVRLKQ